MSWNAHIPGSGTGRSAWRSSATPWRRRRSRPTVTMRQRADRRRLLPRGEVILRWPNCGCSSSPNHGWTRDPGPQQCRITVAPSSIACGANNLIFGIESPGCSEAFDVMVGKFQALERLESTSGWRSTGARVTNWHPSCRQNRDCQCCGTTLDRSNSTYSPSCCDSTLVWDLVRRMRH